MVPNDEPWAVRRTVTPEYFRVMGIPLLKGRYFADQDTVESALVAFINGRMARRYWLSEEPIGSRIKIEDPKNSPGEAP